MKTLIITLFSLFTTLSFSSQAKAEALKPVRHAKINIRMVKHVPVQDPHDVGFDEKDICILQSAELPVYDLRNAPANSWTTPLNQYCTDKETGAVIVVSSLLSYGRAQFANAEDDIKYALTGIGVDTDSYVFPSSYATAASKDLNFKSLLLTAPDVPFHCSPKSIQTAACPSDGPIYYSAYVEFED